LRQEWYRLVKAGIPSVIADAASNGILPWVIGAEETYGQAVGRLLADALRRDIAPVLLEHDIAVDLPTMRRFEVHRDAIDDHQRMAVSGLYDLYYGAMAMPAARDGAGHPLGGPGGAGQIGWGFWSPTRALMEALVSDSPLATWDYPTADTAFSRWAVAQGVRLWLVPVRAMHLHQQGFERLYAASQTGGV